ncbi:MAG: YhbY family RNA-binding protein [Oscillospiraceae bacterium]|nr:YhbY family RNA-binding protein [Oscillospiraceae bacterium]
MELTSKQRAQLRTLANGIETILTIGKDGISDNLVKQCRDALEARELVKGKVLENSEYDARSACAELCERTAACPVQVIGSKFVLYRPSHRKDKKDKIVLTDKGGRK